MPFAESITDAIERTAIFLIVFSSETNASQHVAREVELAASYRKPLLSMRIEETPPSKELRYFIGREHWLDAVTPPIESHLPILVAAVRSIVERGRSNPTRDSKLVESGRGLGVDGSTSRLSLGARLGERDDRVRGSTRRTVRLSANIGPHRIASSWGIPLVISPDGGRVAYVALCNSQSSLFVRELDDFGSSLIPGSSEAMCPFFSPDSQSIAFFRHGKLVWTQVTGGTPSTLASVTQDPCGGVWAADDELFFVPGMAMDACSVRLHSDSPSEHGTLKRRVGEVSLRWPAIWTEADAILFAVKGVELRTFDEASIVVWSRRSGQRSELLRGGTCPRWSPTGHVLFARDGAVYAVPVDANSSNVAGKERRIVDGVHTDPYTGAAHYDISAEGTLVYREGHSDYRLAQLVRVERDGRCRSLTAQPIPIDDFQLSPDENSIVACLWGATNRLWLLDLRPGARPVRLSYGAGNDFAPLWHPDGNQVLFASDRGGIPGIYEIPVEGEPVIRPVVLTESEHEASAITPDGATVILGRIVVGRGWELVARRSGLPNDFVPVGFPDGNERHASVSRDGRLLAFASDRSGTWEIYVRRLGCPGPTRLVSTAGGHAPLWSRDGKEVFYRLDDAVYSARLLSNESLAFEEPQVLFRGPYWHSATASRQYATTRDGGFILIQRSSPASSVIRDDTIQVVLGWDRMLLDSGR